MPSLTDLLSRLPWFSDLNDFHRRQMITEVSARIVQEVGDDSFRELLAYWEHIAHTDAKWARYALLKESGLLEPPPRAA